MTLSNLRTANRRVEKAAIARSNILTVMCDSKEQELGTIVFMSLEISESRDPRQQAGPCRWTLALNFLLLVFVFKNSTAGEQW